MTNLLELYENHEAERKGRSLQAKAKADEEKKASLELREAAMKGQVNRQVLSDITQLEGTTARERAGQRASKYVIILPDDNSLLTPTVDMPDPQLLPMMCKTPRTFDLWLSEPALRLSLSRM